MGCVLLSELWSDSGRSVNTVLESYEQQDPFPVLSNSDRLGWYAVFLCLFSLTMDSRNWGEKLLIFHTLGFPNVHNFYLFLLLLWLKNNVTLF